MWRRKQCAPVLVFAVLRQRVGRQQGYYLGWQCIYIHRVILYISSDAHFIPEMHVLSKPSNVRQFTNTSAPTPAARPRSRHCLSPANQAF